MMIRCFIVLGIVTAFAFAGLIRKAGEADNEGLLIVKDKSETLVQKKEIADDSGAIMLPSQKADSDKVQILIMSKRGSARNHKITTKPPPPGGITIINHGTVIIEGRSASKNKTST